MALPIYSSITRLLYFNHQVLQSLIPHTHTHTHTPSSSLPQVLHPQKEQVPMATIASMVILNAKCLSINSSPNNPLKQTSIKPLSLLFLQNLPKGLSTSKPSHITSPGAAAAIAGAIFSALSSSDAAFAAQQIADATEGDNRGLALLLPLIPAIAWVLFNILQPALNQINRMRSDKGIIVGLGIGGALAAAGLMSPESASANELAVIADAASSNDSRGLLLLFVVAPAIGWVLFNILQPALNQINRMRSG